MMCKSNQNNQCDGCMSGAYLTRDGLHLNVDGHPFMSCQKGKYENVVSLPVNEPKRNAIITVACRQGTTDICAIVVKNWMSDRVHLTLPGAKQALSELQEAIKHWEAQQDA